VISLIGNDTDDTQTMKTVPTLHTTAIAVLYVSHASVEAFQVASVVRSACWKKRRFTRTVTAPTNLDDHNIVEPVTDEFAFSLNTTVDATPSQPVLSLPNVKHDPTIISYPPVPSLRECLSFALPALGIYACPPLMSLIDSSFIGRTSSLELAALGPASSISDSAPLPLLFLSIASTNLIAQSFSRNDTGSLTRVSRTALGLGTMGGIVLAIALYHIVLPMSLLYCGENAAATTGSSAHLLAPLCTKYVSIRLIALPAVVVTTIAQAICIGTKDTKTPMISVALAAALNLMGDFLLVNGLGRGITGAAWTK
jgi:hypothetical protein